MKNLLLTKYQQSLIVELVCPTCRDELNQLSKHVYYCVPCNLTFFGEVTKRASN